MRINYRNLAIVLLALFAIDHTIRGRRAFYEIWSGFLPYPLEPRLLTANTA